MFKNKKGFTLIELLIVITIIGILAVAFLPTLLGAPAKGRDTQRIADLQKIQKVLVNHDLESGDGYPENTGSIDSALVSYGAALWTATFETSFGGALPAGPDDVAYEYVDAPGDYSFGLYTEVEIFENANAACDDAADVTLIEAGTPADPVDDGTTVCYAIFTQ